MAASLYLLRDFFKEGRKPSPMTLQSIRRIKPDVVKRMAELMPWHYAECGWNGISYQTCRFCRQGIGEVDGLWKYGVRHYVCSACRDAITEAR